MPSRIIPFRLAAAGAAVVLAACSSASSVTTPPGATTGSLAISIAGLPSDVSASLAVTGPGGYSQTVTTSTTLTNLAPGSYTITAPRARNVGFDYAAATVLASVTAGTQATGAVAYAIRTFPTRATANRADETTQAKYHLFYVLPSDGIDRGLDTNGTITRTTSSWNRWFAAQTGGRYLRLDTSDGALDITFVRLPRTDATMTSYGDFIRDTLEKDLGAAGYLSAANTLVLAYYDGGSQSRCGSAASPPGLPGVVAGIYLKGRATLAGPCAGNPIAATPTAPPTYIEFVGVHEALHLLGIVSAAAPNYVAGGHVGNDATDLMYAGSLPWRPATLDVTKTSYYNPAGLGAGIANLASSPYLVSVGGN
jgi:hypothetical protein